jgi:hypothetical protein
MIPTPVERPLRPLAPPTPIPDNQSTSTPTTTLPPQFASFADVFQKANADKLPPHRSYDCAIDLLPDQQPPYGQIYSLSPDEEKLVQEYLDENIKKGFIRKSTSSAGAPIFFVDKEKGAKTMGKAPQKRLVVNYQKLDMITHKFRYPRQRFSPKSTSAQRTTSFASGKAMSGKRHLEPSMVFLSTW